MAIYSYKDFIENFLILLLGKLTSSVVNEIRFKLAGLNQLVLKPK